MYSQPINVIIEVFPQDNLVKSKTMIIPETQLTKAQKEQINNALSEARRDGRRIWTRNHSGFKIRREFSIK